MKRVELYKVFIASPSGNDDFRELCKNTLLRFSSKEGMYEGFVYWPLGWLKDVPGGAGRGQGLINPLIRECDYFILVVADRWGTPTGGYTELGEDFTSGIAEEYALAISLLRDAKSDMKDALVLFQEQRHRAGRNKAQLAKVNAFRKDLSASGTILYKTFKGESDFVEQLDLALAHWNSEGHIKADLKVKSTGTLPEKYQHPWLAGAMLRRHLPALAAGVEAGLDHCWNVFEERGYEEAGPLLKNMRCDEALRNLEMARMHCLRGGFRQALNAQAVALSTSTASGDVKLIALANCLLGDIYMASGEFDLAIESYEALAVDSRNDGLMLADIHCRLGIVHRKKADYDESERLLAGRPLAERADFHWKACLGHYRSAEDLVPLPCDSPVNRSLLFSIIYGSSHAYYGLREFEMAKESLDRILQEDLHESPLSQKYLRVLRSKLWVDIRGKRDYKDFTSTVDSILSRGLNLARFLRNRYEEVLLLEAAAKLELDMRYGDMIDFKAALRRYREALRVAKEAGFSRRAEIIKRYIENLENIKPEKGSYVEEA